MSRAVGIRYISVFSGIEAASVAVDGMGWEALAFSEIEPFPCAVLAERYPGVANLGDITKVDWKRYRGKCDLVVGGSPCQSFSVAGKREGLSGASGLMWEYVRCVREVRPRWFLWENVPGALSSEHGEAFRCLLSAMDELGYGMAWRVLDAQFFGVAQRRRRLFLVGHLGSRPPVEVLFEPDGLRRDPETSREKRAELAARAGRGAACAGFKYSAGAAAGSVAYGVESANTLTADWHAPAVFPIQGSCIDRSDAAGPAGPAGPGYSKDGSPCYTLDTRDKHAVAVVGGEAIPINEQVAVRCNKLGRGTGLGVGEAGDPAYTVLANHPHAVCTATRGKEGEQTPEPTCMTDDNANSAIDRDSCGTLKCGGSAPIVMADDNANSAIDRDSCGTLKCGGSPSGATRPTETFEGNLTPGEMQSERVYGTMGPSPTLSTCSPTLDTSGNGFGVARESRMRVRRLTPTECERLQGFPDEWTAIPWRGKPAEECPDGPRYKAIGNSMAVPVMRWIFEGIEMAEGHRESAVGASPQGGRGAIDEMKG